MAVEASHRINFFSPELFSSREIVRSLNSSAFQSINGCVLPNESPSPPDVVFPVFPEYPVMVANKASMNNTADSGLTCSIQPVGASPSCVEMSRKRLRDECSHLDGGYSSKCVKLSGAWSPWMDADAVFQMNQQQCEIDRYVAEHIQRVQREVERRRRQSPVIPEAIQEFIMRRLKEKDDELSRLGKLNWAFQEKIKSLFVENQLWRDLAETNEAAVNSLRANLEQVLAHVGEGQVTAAGCVPDEDTASSCGSSGPYGGALSLLPEECSKSNTGTGFRSCKNCGKFESTVLLLPCRHLCLCTTCGSSSFTSCPVCSALITATVHVNMS